MQKQDIEQAILDFIKTYSNKDYVGKIKINNLIPKGYEVILYPQGEFVPLVFYAELDDDKFLKYLKEEIRNKKFHLSNYGELNKREPNLCYPINNSCSCNDKRRIN